MSRNVVALGSRERAGKAPGMGPGRRRGTRRRLRPTLFELEERSLLASFLVTSIADDGSAGTLRSAINLANSTKGANTVEFSPLFSLPQTITLSTNLGLLDLNNTSGGSQTTAINGPATGVTISGNHNVRVFAVEGGATATLSFLAITAGNSGSDYGGAIYNSGAMTLNNCTVSNSSAGGTFWGGGLYNNSGTANLTNCTFSNNTAGHYGGGVYINSGTVNLTNCTFSGNSAGDSYYGGGVYNNATVNLVSCTFSENRATYGGGLYNNSSATVTSSIFAGNTGSSGGPDINGGVTSKGRNLIGDTNGNSGWINAGANADLLNKNPLLAQFGSYGGPTQTYALKPNSPAIGAGAAAPGLKDQRGFPMDAPKPDIGAFQTQVNNVPLVVTSPTDGITTAPRGLTLRQAVRLANLLNRAATITFDATSTNAAFKTAQSITLASAQLELSSTTGLQKITGPTAGVTINGGGTTRLFMIDKGVTASISGLSMTNGKTTGVDNQYETGGGGVLNLGTLSLTNCTISGSSARKRSNEPSQGGGLFSDGVVNLTGCVINGNSAGDQYSQSQYGSGGGVYIHGAATLTNCTISGNTAWNGGGFWSDGNVTLEACTIKDNTSTANGDSPGIDNPHFGGGGLFLAGATVANLGDCVITGNSAGKYGGGVYALDSVNLTSCTISGNTAAQSGGGAFLKGSATSVMLSTISKNTATNANGGGVETFAGVTTISDSTISSNAATGGRGGGVMTNANATTKVINSTFSDNKANAGGGLSNNGTTFLTSSTVSANSSGVGGGGGLFNSGPATLTNTIVAANVNASQNPSDIEGGVSVKGTYNLIGPGGSGNLPTGAGTGNIVLTDLTGLGLAPLAYYGGPTQTMALLPGSKAIRAGTTVPYITTDQRGFLLDSPKPDIGASQVYNTLLVNTNLDGAAVPRGKLDLRGAVDLANVLPGAHTITFGLLGPTIKLTAGELTLTNTGGVQTINGGLGVTVSGGGLSRVFQVDAGVNASFVMLTITDGRATGNGGGVNSSGVLTLRNCTFAGNTASGFGGGLAIAAGGRADLTNCTFSSNAAATQGGGLYNASTGPTTLTNCTFSKNAANLGAGLYIAVNTSATLTNCTISGNKATDRGGALFTDAGATTTLTYCTVSGNTAANGGGLFNSGATKLSSTIDASNAAPVAPDASGAFTSLGNNLIGKTDGSSGWAASDLTGTVAQPLDPKLAPLANYSGTTQTVALLNGSPAIGKGSVAPGVTTDQRGLARSPVAVDIGAFQTSLVVESTDGSVNKTPAQLTLPGALSLANDFGGPIVISFDPAVFTGGQTITLTGGQLELNKIGGIPTWTILGPGADKLTISGGNHRVFQVDKNVTAYFSGLTIKSDLQQNGAGLEVLGTANVVNCTFAGIVPSFGGAIEVSGGTLTANHDIITGWFIGIQVSDNSTATITTSTLSGNGNGVLVGSSGADACTVTVHGVDLSGDTVGVGNISTSRTVDATFNWWGFATGPTITGPGAATRGVEFSPWLGDAKSLNLTTPDSLGFSITQGVSYEVIPTTAGAGSPNLTINLVGGGAPWTVTPNGVVLFVGGGGNVTIYGESGPGFNTDAFTITNAAVTFGANDAFNGAAIQFVGNSTRKVVAKGAVNNFDVSGWTGAGTLVVPTVVGAAVSTVTATKSFGHTATNTSSGYTLTQTSLKSTDGMALTLSGAFTTANLTALATSADLKDNVIVDASAFRGVTNLTAGGVGNAILFGGGSAKGGGGTLTATGSRAVLIGGPGKNTLLDNGAGFNILIGGGGAGSTNPGNTITGNGNDILISGTTTYGVNNAANIAALDAILGEWSSNDSYAARISKISAGITVGANTYKLNNTTVKSNGNGNTVSDGIQPNQQNWFIITAKDTVTAAGTETRTTIPS
jgi:Right handed beta helix region